MSRTELTTQTNLSDRSQELVALTALLRSECAQLRETSRLLRRESQELSEESRLLRKNGSRLNLTFML